MYIQEADQYLIFNFLHQNNPIEHDRLFLKILSTLFGNNWLEVSTAVWDILPFGIFYSWTVKFVINYANNTMIKITANFEMHWKVNC